MFDSCSEHNETAITDDPIVIDAYDSCITHDCGLVLPHMFIGGGFQCYCPRCERWV